MKAAVFRNPGSLSIEDVPEPQLRRDNMIVRINCCAICGSDLKMLRHGNPRIKDKQIIGHEFCATVEDVGADVDGFRIGDRVVMATTISCGHCEFCREGLTNLCPDITPISSAFPGAFAKYMAIPWEGIARGHVLKVPESVETEAAALAEPMSCAINAQMISSVKLGDAVAVVGAGPLGCLHAEIARAVGATKVIITQRSKYRLEKARALKVDHVVDAAETDQFEEIVRLTNGRGADVVIVCAPNASAQAEALRAVRKNGVLNLFASLPKDAPEVVFNSRLIHYGQVSVTGASDSAPIHVRIALDLLQRGAISTNVIITHQFPLEEIFEGFRLMEQKRCLKVLIIP